MADRLSPESLARLKKSARIKAVADLRMAIVNQDIEALGKFTSNGARPNIDPQAFDAAAEVNTRAMNRGKPAGADPFERCPDCGWAICDCGPAA